MFGDSLLPSECSLLVEELKHTSLCFQVRYINVFHVCAFWKAVFMTNWVVHCAVCSWETNHCSFSQLGGTT